MFNIYVKIMRKKEASYITFIEKKKLEKVNKKRL